MLFQTLVPALHAGTRPDRRACLLRFVPWMDTDQSCLFDYSVGLKPRFEQWYKPRVVKDVCMMGEKAYVPTYLYIARHLSESVHALRPVAGML